MLDWFQPIWVLQIYRFWFDKHGNSKEFNLKNNPVNEISRNIIFSKLEICQVLLEITISIKKQMWTVVCNKH